ncbi:hypothetical protein [Nitrospira sp. M1]
MVFADHVGRSETTLDLAIFITVLNIFSGINIDPIMHHDISKDITSIVVILKAGENIADIGIKKNTRLS